MTTIISFIIVIGIIVFVHEVGHFIAAKLSGVRVEVFSLGFPPKMIGRKVGETEYQLAWIPLGGYVKMTGMADESFDDSYDPDDPRGFMAQSLIKKIFIITAGVLMNFVLAFFVYALISWQSGLAVMEGTDLSMVMEESPASIAGLEAGDRIVTINGQQIEDWEDLTSIIREYPGRPITVSWLRADSMITAEIVPKPTPEFNLSTARTDTVGKIGVAGTFVRHPVGPFKAIVLGADQVVWVIRLNVLSISALVTGHARLKDLTGPIGIAKMSGDSAKSGIASFFAFIALISVSIGFLNILPIPMLDGGHLVFILIEAAIRRPIPEKLKLNIMKLGLVALLMLILIVSYNDIVRIFF